MPRQHGRRRAEPQPLGLMESLSLLTAGHQELRATGQEDQVERVLKDVRPHTHAAPEELHIARSSSGKPLQAHTQSILAENVSQYNLQNFSWKCISS